MSFLNKVVLITGGSSGIGAATAIKFTKEGANVVIVGRNEKKLNDVVEKCISAGKKPLSIKADITHDGEVERIVKETIEALGNIDVLVNNAGLFRFVSILDKSALETYDLIMNTNLRAQVRLIHFAAPYLIKTKGNIINISSAASDAKPSTSFTFGFYSTSKSALDRFTVVAAAEFASYGVRVNAVSPGPVKTDILENAGLALADLSIDTPLNRVSEPEEVADVILFLASEKAKAITGSNYLTDNGYLLMY